MAHTLLFHNCTLVLPDRLLHNGALLTEHDKIVWLGTEDAVPAWADTSVDCRGNFLSPGFIDIHTHGGGGGSFLEADADQFRIGFKTHLAHGTTTVLPTVIVRSVSQMKRLATIHKQLSVEKGLPDFPGYFLEGPFISANPSVQGFRKSSGSDPVIKPEDYLPILKAGMGHILRWMAAPELEGALPFAKTLKAHGIRPCMGHCAPVYSQVMAAIAAGYDCTVHLYSAMSTITRKNGFRRAGLLETTLLCDELMSEIVADGRHVPPELLKLAVKCKGYDRLILISDSCPFAGTDDGQHFTMLGCDVMVEDGVCKLTDRSAFAGSVVCGDGLVRTVYKACGIPLWAAVRMATRTPAYYMGWAGKKGELIPGADADLVLFDENIRVLRVYTGGRECRNLQSRNRERVGQE